MKKTVIARHAAAFGICAPLMAMSTLARAQDATPPVATDAAEQSEGIETIIVTATKRAESAREIPGSVTALKGEELEQRGVQDLKDLVKLVPGVNVTQPSDNATRVTIRGVAGEANTNPTSGILFGNVSFTDAYVPHVTLDPNPFDLQNVEVLKGPQGTLFGASALNGAIRYVPQKPEFGAFGGKYYTQYREVEHGGIGFGAGAAVNIPVGDDFAMRLVGFDERIPGFVDNEQTVNDSNDGRQYGLRGMLAWRPIEKMNVDFTYAYQRTRHDDVSATDNFDGQLKGSDRPRPSPHEQQYSLANLSVGYEFNAFRLISETAYLSKNYWATNEASNSVQQNADHPIVKFTADEDSSSWSQEFRLVSTDKDSPWRWVTGVFASQQDIDQLDRYQLGDASVPAAQTAQDLDAFFPSLGTLWLGFGQPDYYGADIDVRVRELAGFADVTRRIGESWEAELGGRLYKTRSGGVVDSSGMLVSLQGSPDGLKHLDDSVDDSGFSPRASLLWHANENALFYGAVSKGYRVGGVQWGAVGITSTSTAPPTFKTDKIWNYEIGARTQWLHNTLTLDATAFYEDWTKPQVLVLDTSGLGSYVDNVGAVAVKGIEGAMQWLIPGIRGLSLNAAATYTDAKTTDSYDSGGGQTVPSGTRWPLSPKWQVASTLNYKSGKGDFLYGGYISYAYMSEATYGITQSTKIFNFGTWDAQINFGSVALPTTPELSLTLSNVFDKRGIITAFTGDTYNNVEYVRPRTLILRLSGTF